MSLFNTPQKFGSLTKLLHWSIAALFSMQYYLVYRRDYFPDDAPEKLNYILLHKSVGITIFGLAVIFLVIRHFGKHPALPLGMNAIERLLARLTHICLWAAILMMPISGTMMSQMSGYGAKLFGYPLPTFVGVDKAMAGTFHEMHSFAGIAMMVFVGLHILGAFVHLIIHRDRVMQRMLPFSKGG